MKRFIETSILEKEWFIELDDIGKATWFYLLLRCDAVGVYKINKRYEIFILGREVDWNRMMKISSDNLEYINDKTILINKYCDIQYGDAIKDPDTNCKPLLSHHKLLIKHGLYDRYVTGKIESVKTIRNRLTSVKKEKIKIRDEFTCQYCYKQFPKDLLYIDHFIPLPHGDNQDTNLITSCNSCNSKKSNMMPEELIERNVFTYETLYRVCNYLHSEYKILYNVKEKEKEEEQKKEEEEEIEQGFKKVRDQLRAVK